MAATSTPRRRTPKPAAAAAPTRAAAAETAASDDGAASEEANLVSEAAAGNAQQSDDSPLTGAEPSLSVQLDAMRVDFVYALRNIARADVPYDRLLEALLADGWFLQLKEIGASADPDGATLIAFDLVIGYDPTLLQSIDRVTFKVPGNVAAPSLWARANAYQSLMMILFQQLPPAPAPASSQQAQSPAPAGGKPDPVRNAQSEPLDLIERRTTDGLPVYYNPFELADDPDDILDSFAASLRKEVPEITSLEGLSALFQENRDMFDYTKETRPGLFDELVADVLNTRRAELEELEEPAAPTRAAAGRRPTPRR